MKTNEFIDLIDKHVQQLHSMLPRLLKLKRLKMALIMAVATIIAVVIISPFVMQFASSFGNVMVLLILIITYGVLMIVLLSEFFDKNVANVVKKEIDSQFSCDESRPKTTAKSYILNNALYLNYFDKFRSEVHKQEFMQYAARILSQIEQDQIETSLDNHEVIQIFDEGKWEIEANHKKISTIDYDAYKLNP